VTRGGRNSRDILPKGPKGEGGRKALGETKKNREKKESFLFLPHFPRKRDKGTNQKKVGGAG